jgi:predicted esterase
MNGFTNQLVAAARLALLTASIGAMQATPAGQDLRLTYRSAVDGTDQPYRLYVPAAYDGTRAYPLVVAMHGTGGNENSLFEDKRLPPGELIRVAEKHGVLLVSPNGRGTTEYRGIGENDIFCVLADLKRHYRVDPDRIYLTGQSMGGTGAAYLALRHPDLFAAAAPLAAAYSYPWLAENGQHVPFWWIQGATDAPFYLEGVAEGVARMRELGQDVRYDLIPNEAHPAGLMRIDAAVEWLVQQRRKAHPREYVFAVDTPLHGRAFWTEVTALEVPGRIAYVRARAEGKDRAHLSLENVTDVAFFPDPKVFDLAQPLSVKVDAADVFSGVIAPDRQLRLQRVGGQWRTSLEPRHAAALTDYRTNPVATAPEALDNNGTEARLANWITDAMRAATGADIALYNRVHDRGRGIAAGTVDIVDLLQCSLPFDQHLVVTELTGKELLEILNANVPDLRQLTAPTRPMHRLLQVSGMRYTFDPTRRAGDRVIESDVQPDRVYRVVLEGQAVQRETVALAGRFRKLKYTQAPAAFTMALYGHAVRHGRIESRIEGRVRQVH